MVDLVMREKTFVGAFGRGVIGILEAKGVNVNKYSTNGCLDVVSLVNDMRTHNIGTEEELKSLETLLNI